MHTFIKLKKYEMKRKSLLLLLRLPDIQIPFLEATTAANFLCVLPLQARYVKIPVPCFFI